MTIWLDGRLLPEAPPGPAAGTAGSPRCYTTARYESGRARLSARHARRLARDALALGLGRVDEDECRAALAALGQAVFADGAGVVRLEASRDATGALRLVGTTRALGIERAEWTAIRAPVVHPGPRPHAGAKLADRPHLAAARAAAGTAGADDALLADAAGRLVEGARTNVFVALQGGAWVTPPLARGGVAGLAREVLCEAVPELACADVAWSDLARSREIVLANAVRGAVPVVRLDGAAVGPGAPGPLAARLRAAFEAAAT